MVVAARITVEAANGTAVNGEAVVERLLRYIFESEEAAKIDLDWEQLNEIFEVEESSQTDLEQEQLNPSFPNTRESRLNQD